MRRLRAAAVALAIGIGSTLGAWAVIGFQGFADYPALLRKLADTHYDDSYSVAGIVDALRLDPMVGRGSDPRRRWRAARLVLASRA